MFKSKPIIVYGCNIDGDPDWLNDLYFEGVYLHGNASEKNGYDIIGIDERPTEEGIYDVFIIYANGKGTEGKLFYWKSKEFKNKNRGLVVENDDYNHMQDAKEKYERRAEAI